MRWRDCLARDSVSASLVSLSFSRAMTCLIRSSEAWRSSRSFFAPGTPGSVPAVLTETVLALASSLLMSLTNCVVSSTSVIRLSFWASADFASASAFFNSAWLQPVVAMTASTISQAYLMRTSPLCL